MYHFLKFSRCKCNAIASWGDFDYVCGLEPIIIINYDNLVEMEIVDLAVINYDNLIKFC